jgi:uncharacterized protein YlxW (UPF0749 family)
VPETRDRRTIPLLELITRESLDLDYQHVAEQRRTAGDEPEPRSPRTPWHGLRLTWVVVAVFGLLVALAAVQNSRNAPVEQASKDELIQQVTQARGELAALQDRLGTLRQQNADTDTTYGNIGQVLDQAQAQTDSLSATAGFGAVSGSGVEVDVDDSPSGGASGQVRDADLANLVNGLWQAGATAIAVNGERLTALSALRNSGTVIRVNGTSLSRPYAVDALGDPRTLPARLAQTASGSAFHDVTTTYGMPTSTHTEQSLTLPAAPAAMLRLLYAAPAPSEEDKK